MPTAVYLLPFSFFLFPFSFFPVFLFSFFPFFLFLFYFLFFFFDARGRLPAPCRCSSFTAHVRGAGGAQERVQARAERRREPRPDLEVHPELQRGDLHGPRACAEQRDGEACRCWLSLPRSARVVREPRADVCRLSPGRASAQRERKHQWSSGQSGPPMWAGWTTPMWAG